MDMEVSLEQSSLLSLHIEKKSDQRVMTWMLGNEQRTDVQHEGHTVFVPSTPQL